MGGARKPQPPTRTNGFAMADDKTPEQSALDQSEIDGLLEDAGGSGGSQGGGAAETPQGDTADDTAQVPAEPSVATSETVASQPEENLAGGSPPDESSMPEKDVDLLLAQAERALASIGSELPEDLPPGASTYQFEEFCGAPATTENATLDLISDVELDLKIELGRTHMYLEDVLKLRQGSVVPLDKLAGDPVDIYVNGRLIARGEILVLNDNFCVRVAELIAGTGVASA